MIDDVLAMLEVRASEELPGWVAERLGLRTPRARTRVLSVYPARAARIKGMASYEDYSIAEDAVRAPPTPVVDDPALLEALRAQRVYTLVGEGEDTRLIATFEARGEPRQVLEARGYGVGVHARDLISMARKYYERLVESETDPLTRLSNRRLFQSHVDEGIRRWVASGRGYYFAMLDLDRFKRINDDFGHLYGDEILVHFANLMRATFRSADQLYRFGGEEFVVIFGVEPPERGGEGTLERFRAAMEAAAFPGIGRVTVSAGFTRICDPATPATTLYDRADRALYYAKTHGRNRVCSWDDLVASGEMAASPAANTDATLF